MRVHADPDQDSQHGYYHNDTNFYLQMDSPILIEDGYIDSSGGSMRESYSVHCDDGFTPSPGKA
jgi:hypothetical protein